MRRKLYYMTKEEDYQSLGQDAADLYLFRKSNEQAQTDGIKLKIFLISSACIVASFLLFILF